MTTKTITFDELKGLLRARVTVSHSLRQCAGDLGVSPAYLSKILITKKASIGPSVLKALGYEAVTVYRRVHKTKGR